MKQLRRVVVVALATMLANIALASVPETPPKNANVVLNADGSVTFNVIANAMVKGVKGTYVNTQTWSAANVSANEHLMTQVVRQNAWANATINPLDVVSAILAVRNGLLTKAKLTTWATNNKIKVDQIYTSRPTAGTLASPIPSLTEPFAMAANDPLVTTNGGVPTLLQAAKAASKKSKK